jgi:hypothetical protein
MSAAGSMKLRLTFGVNHELLVAKNLEVIVFFSVYYLGFHLERLREVTKIFRTSNRLSEIQVMHILNTGRIQ